MAWTVEPADPVFAYRGYEIALQLYTDDMGDNLVMLFREASDPNAVWQGMGYQDGQTWGPSSFAEEVIAMGGFQTWLVRFLILVNAKFAKWVQDNFGVAPASDPKTFAEFQLWVRDHLMLTGDNITTK